MAGMNAREPWRHVQMGSGGLPVGRLEGVGPRMEAFFFFFPIFIPLACDYRQRGSHINNVLWMAG